MHRRTAGWMAEQDSHLVRGGHRARRSKTSATRSRDARRRQSDLMVMEDKPSSLQLPTITITAMASHKSWSPRCLIRATLNVKNWVL